MIMTMIDKYLQASPAPPEPADPPRVAPMQKDGDQWGWSPEEWHEWDAAKEGAKEEQWDWGATKEEQWDWWQQPKQEQGWEWNATKQEQWWEWQQPKQEEWGPKQEPKQEQASSSTGTKTWQRMHEMRREASACYNEGGTEKLQEEEDEDEEEVEIEEEDDDDVGEDGVCRQSAPWAAQNKFAAEKGHLCNSSRPQKIPGTSWIDPKTGEKLWTSASGKTYATPGPASRYMSYCSCQAFKR